MPSTGIKRRTVFALLIWIGAPVLSTPAVLAADLPEITLQTVRSRYAAALEPLQTVWTKSELRRSLAEPALKPGESTGDPVEWAIDGQKWLLTFDLDGPQANGLQGWYSYDGHRVSRKQYLPTDESGKALSLEYRTLASATDLKVRSTLSAGTYLGPYFHDSRELQNGLSVSDLLAREDAVLAGPELQDGVPCYRVDCHNPSIDNTRTAPVSVWFDPQHGFLPRRVRRIVNAPQRPIELNYLVPKFQLVTTDQGRQVWFPAVCVYKHIWGHDLLEVHEVTIGTLPDNLSFTLQPTRELPGFNGDDREDHQRMAIRWAEAQNPKQTQADKKSQDRRRQGPTQLATLPIPRLPARQTSAVWGSGTLTFAITGLVLISAGAVLAYRNRRR